MSARIHFVRLFGIGCRVLAVLFAVIASVAVAGGPGYAADSKGVAVLPAPKSMPGTPSGAELVGKLLAERSTSSDPDVPLPQRNLTSEDPASVPLSGPQIYGRREEGSVVVGLKIPIPADRGVFQHNTRYGGNGAATDAAGSAR